MTDREKLIELLRKGYNKTPFYEDIWEGLADCLLENGVIVPPCKIGDTLYDISEYLNGTLYPKMYVYKADYICFYDKYPDRKENVRYFTIDDMDYVFDDFGKTVFFT